MINAADTSQNQDHFTTIKGSVMETDGTIKEFESQVPKDARFIKFVARAINTGSLEYGVEAVKEEPVEIFYVYCVNGRPPQHKHYSEDEAIKEAERLARKEPNKEFIILQEIARVNAVIDTKVDYT